MPEARCRRPQGSMRRRVRRRSMRHFQHPTLTIDALQRPDKREKLPAALDSLMRSRRRVSSNPAFAQDPLRQLLQILTLAILGSVQEDVALVGGQFRFE